jgi:hypothetical protein
MHEPTAMQRPPVMLVNAEDKRPVGRREIEIKADDIARTFSTNSGSSDSLNVWLR